MTPEELNLDLVIRLAVIVGHCNVLYEMMEEGSEQAKRLAQIRGIVASAMKDLTEHQQKNGSIEAKSGISNPAPATESQPQPIENPQRKTSQKTPTPVERPVRQNQRQSLPNAG
jgi:DNA-binding FrmR family transcriptional regulator